MNWPFPLALRSFIFAFLRWLFEQNLVKGNTAGFLTSDNFRDAQDSQGSLFLTFRDGPSD